MSYAVIWTPRSERDLTEIWLGSRWRYLISQSADQLDMWLSQNPTQVGESRAANLRIVFLPAFVAEFEVDEATHTVYVRTVWQHPKRPPI
jgi:hypothetical protein